MGVGQKVDQNLSDPVGVDQQRRQVGGDRLRSSDLLGGLGLAAHRPHRVVDQRRGVGRHRLDRQPPGVAAGEVEQVVEQADQVAGVVEDDLDRFRLLGAELLALQHQQLGEALDRGQRAAQLVRGGEHELVFDPVEPVAFARLPLQLVGHLVEGGAERRGLREAADLDPGAEVALGQPAGGVDQLLERPAHRGDQAAEEQRRAGQPGDQPGADEQRRVAGLAVDVVAQGSAPAPARRRPSPAPPRAAGPGRGGCGRRSRPGRSGRSRPRSPGAAGGSGRRRSPPGRSAPRRRSRSRSSAGSPATGSAVSRLVVHMLAPAMGDEATGTPDGIDARRGRGLVRRERARRRAAAQLRADRRRPLEPDLPGHRRQPAAAGRCAGRRSASGSAPPTTWPASTGSSRRSAATPVPVAPVVGLCEDESVNEAPFYVMEFVEGPILRGLAEAEAFPDERRPPGDRRARRRHPGRRSTPSTPTPPGSASSARKEDYVARQLHRWQGQWEKSKTRELPLVDEVHERLAAAIPEQGPATIVHGDYRLDNMILTPEGEVAAVVDWELCTLGDPLADVGLLMVYWPEARRGGDLARAAGQPRARLPRPRRAARALRRALRPRPLRTRLLHRPRLLEAGDHPRGRLRPLRGRRLRQGRRRASKYFARVVERLAEAADAGRAPAPA